MVPLGSPQPVSWERNTLQQRFGDKSSDKVEKAWRAVAVVDSVPVQLFVCVVCGKNEAGEYCRAEKEPEG